MKKAYVPQIREVHDRMCADLEEMYRELLDEIVEELDSMTDDMTEADIVSMIQAKLGDIVEV